MKAVLIGSYAYRDLDDCNDVDVLCDEEWKEAFYAKVQGEHEANAVHGCCCTTEVTVPTPGSAWAHILESVDERFAYEMEPLSGLRLRVAPLDVLAALKRAHLILPSGKWQRHMTGFQRLKEIFFSPSGEQSDLAARVFELHRSECLAKAKPHPRLDANKKEFFGDRDYEIFDHDSIHRALAHPRPPAYESIKDGEVWCSKIKWDALSNDERLRCAVEEVSILALERSILPALFLAKPYAGAAWAIDMALEKLCTTIASGWFRDFCIDNWAAIRVGARSLDPSTRFFEGVKLGIVEEKQ